MDIDGYKLCALYRLCNAQRTWIVFVQAPRKSRSEDPTFLGLKSAHTDRLFVVISSEKISERFLIGAKVSAHEPISNATLVDVLYDRLDYETHATDKTMRYL